MQGYIISGSLFAALCAAIYFFARKIGKDDERESKKDADLAALKREAQAAANAPSSRDSLVDRLRHGGAL